MMVGLVVGFSGARAAPRPWVGSKVSRRARARQPDHQPFFLILIIFDCFLNVCSLLFEPFDCFLVGLDLF